MVQWTQGGNETFRRTLRIMVVDSYARVVDKLEDAVGGTHYEIYSLDVGTLAGTTPLTVTAVTLAGIAADPFDGQIQVA